ncbi:MAG: response regulator transcription factor [Bacteroidales bacterium]|jgi:DNA-binding response OmpR family regulator|nr:response regulator transcription factor [Bacteroidales bacterium]MCK9447826.1 response regulator transcription factor [Bacteroidales bacterium]MDD3700066.1 response regulator transcription factor [Bacteroidales bacterium]MDY0368838.1 response regulator transcription factor [Bacteroidales bacterium]
MEDQINVLLAEDDKNLGTILKAYLEAKGFPTTLCSDGHAALEKFKRNDFDFCILDVMMPVMDGFTLAAEIRKLDKKIPILFLTAKAMQDDKLKGFELGADDYLTKPFSMEELMLRMKAIIRRSAEDTVRLTVFKIGKFTFDYNRQLLTHENGEESKLTSKESELLRLLSENLNRVLDRSVALNKIWYDDSYFNARSMDVYITKLRKYFKNDSSIELMNVHGVGFKLLVNE